ncbi:TerB family tellurite resistance protein [Falsochrobactrum sp. TDYN1]|uniref:TerB family tellurite resistance protein n=1 Tax=Falsochrobactrum tianjinense TaxID=2706015 RepID=A0A949UTA3_9HYPH|nr:TerB family tellurite resistance protein [Falsochrobactrum sp. TDYN1]MBV2141928.1 TerB family tellurite resistance protein [Falsochrobactrum sp. TDYN1]
MFERLLDFIKDLPGSGLRERGEKFSDADPRLAAAALLFHVMAADGETRESERALLSTLLAQKYGLKGDTLKQLIKAAQEADQEAVSLTNFTSVLKRHLDYQARLDFILLMQEIVYADGTVSEVEVDVMWRIAQLVGISEPDRQLIEARMHESSHPAPDL